MIDSKAKQSVRLATAADVPQLAKAIARAFFDDPVAVWSCPSDKFRPYVLERFHRARLEQLLLRGEVWTTDGLASAALWAGPGEWRTTGREDLALARSIYQSRAVAHPAVLARSPLVAYGLTGV
ncbi:MAG: hypothetical protein ACRDKE_09355, partial [Solirubrobacterales bacterium]